MSTTSSKRLRLLSGLATKPALVDELLPEFVRDSGVDVDTLFEPTSVLRDFVQGGEPFDVLIGVSETVEMLASAGLISPDSVCAVARSGIGVAVAETSVARPLDTVEGFVSTMIGARSVAYSRAGASGIYFAGLLDRLGIREQVDAKATVLEKGLTATALVDGRADVAIQQMSELASVPGAIILGSLPQEIQSYTAFSAGMSVATVHRSESLALLRAVSGERAHSAYASTGLVRAE